MGNTLVTALMFPTTHDRAWWDLKSCCLFFFILIGKKRKLFLLLQVPEQQVNSSREVSGGKESTRKLRWTVTKAEPESDGTVQGHDGNCVRTQDFPSPGHVPSLSNRSHPDTDWHSEETCACDTDTCWPCRLARRRPKLLCSYICTTQSLLPSFARENTCGKQRLCCCIVKPKEFKQQYRW